MDIKYIVIRFQFYTLMQFTVKVQININLRNVKNAPFVISAIFDFLGTGIYEVVWISYKTNEFDL